MTNHPKIQHSSMYKVRFLFVRSALTIAVSPPAPSPPSGVSVSQNGLGSVLVSWTPPSGEPAVTGYIIYYQQDGGQRLSQSAGSADTTATITGLTAGVTHSVTIVATSTTLPSIESEAEILTIGI